MKILKAIGGLFVKLWHWIKETAWVQPLLIVGAIFAIIFSIPHFSKWIGQFTFTDNDAYYVQFQKSLNLETKGEQNMSEADKLTTSIYEGSFEDKIDESYGKKFFVIYVSKECTDCANAQSGFETLVSGWNSSYAPDKAGEQFKMYSIFADEESSTDDTDPDHSAFERYLVNFTEFFEEAGGRLEERPYRDNANLTESQDYSYFEKSDEDNFKTPTILLVDYTDEAKAANVAGVSEILFGVKGSNKNEKAKLLWNMWNHLETDDDAKTNPFSEFYIKK
ncbi:MAG: hypothetical protein MJ239_02590 [Bacilli bacterium]|nr:hypothetical protein [Bacilli bacterium]